MFEVMEHGHFLDAGTHVEGLGIVAKRDPNCFIKTLASDNGDFLGVRVVDSDDLRCACHGMFQHPTDGWYRLGLHFSILRPLTPAARTMLAIAKAPHAR